MRAVDDHLSSDHSCTRQETAAGATTAAAPSWWCWPDGLEMHVLSTSRPADARSSASLCVTSGTVFRSTSSDRYTPSPSFYTAQAFVSLSPSLEQNSTTPVSAQLATLSECDGEVASLLATCWRLFRRVGSNGRYGETSTSWNLAFTDDLTSLRVHVAYLISSHLIWTELDWTWFAVSFTSVQIR